MFESSHPFAFFDYFRIPYTVVDGSAGPSSGVVGQIRPTEPASGNVCRLLWCRSEGPVRSRRRLGRLGRIGRYQLGDFTVVCHVSAESPGSLLASSDKGWSRAEPLIGAGGAPVSWVWTHTDGSVLLPFDPGEVMQLLWSERYTTVGRSTVVRVGRRVAVRSYYVVRPLLPRTVQLALRRTLARRQTLPAFPRWPSEHGLHDLYRWLFAQATAVAGRPVPSIDAWPEGKSWAMVLSHDVETAGGVRDMALLRQSERDHGYRSGWNFVPERYTVDDDTIAAVKADGCEVGVHGLKHDGRDLASERTLSERLPAIRMHAEHWGAVGFRSPATQRAWALMPTLGFDYDSSYTDTDPYEPQPGGCCTYLPFFIDHLVELPITLPQDHTLFAILQHRDGQLWLDKAHEIRERGGMVLALSHPDYASDPHVAAAWRSLLEEFAGDDAMWQPLPREAAAWWRRRADSYLVQDGLGWRIQGPAADEGRVRLASAEPGQESGQQ
jgi:hypothetical protein